MNTSRPETAPRSPLERLERQAETLDAVLAASPVSDLPLRSRRRVPLRERRRCTRVEPRSTELLGRTWRDCVCHPTSLATFDAQRALVLQPAGP